MPKKKTKIFTKMVGIFMILTIVIGATWVASLVFFYQRSDRASTAHSAGERDRDLDAPGAPQRKGLPASRHPDR